MIKKLSINAPKMPNGNKVTNGQQLIPIKLKGFKACGLRFTPYTFYFRGDLYLEGGSVTTELPRLV